MFYFTLNFNKKYGESNIDINFEKRKGAWEAWTTGYSLNVEPEEFGADPTNARFRNHAFTGFYV